MADDLPSSTGDLPVAENRREIREEWPAWLILAALWGGSLLVLRRLPARVPVHWNLQGQVDRWGTPLEAALLLPALATGVYLLILAFDWGRLDFKAARAMSPATTRQVRILVLLLLGILQGLILGATLGGGAFRGNLVFACLFGFFILLGNLMPRLEPNAWVGIRIPPTLENREVWKGTHRFAGRLWVIGGVLLLPTCLLRESHALFICLACLTLLAIVPMIYAYRLRALLPR
jgi:uncharacterized membrane protein